jgi:hypothetical protein
MNLAFLELSQKYLPRDSVRQTGDAGSSESDDTGVYSPFPGGHASDFGVKKYLGTYEHQSGKM